jgi:hypothetical protein
VDTAQTFSQEDTGCPEISPSSAKGTKVGYEAKWVSIILLKLSWFLRAEERLSILVLRLSKPLS